jgi:5-methylcytosine-specific restriction endonuclease McrA
VVQGCVDNLGFWDLSGLTDESVLQGLRGFVSSGARVDANVVAHLAEVEERRLHLKAATSSLFEYCLRRLGFSESEAFHRINAARLAKRFPVIFDLLAARSIHLSALRVLRDHLTPENHREVLAAACGKSKKEVEVLVAALAPCPDVPSRIRKLPVKRETCLRADLSQRLPPSPNGRERSQSQPNDLAAEPKVAGPKDAESRGPHALAPELNGTGSRSVGREFMPGAAVSVTQPQGANPMKRTKIEPLSATRYLLRMSVTCEFKGKLDRARDLMSHANPSGELVTIFERALDLLLEALERQRFAQTRRNRARRSPTDGKSSTGSRGVEVKPAQPEVRECPQPIASGKTGPSASPVLQRAESSRDAESEQRGDHESDAVRSARSGDSQDAKRGGSESACSSPSSKDEREKDEARPARRTRREHISNEIRRAVALRDGEQCTYVDEEGRRCPCRAFLQVHHELAHALGGRSTLENLRLLCGAHNRLLAERDFGRVHQERCLQDASRATGALRSVR